MINKLDFNAKNLTSNSGIFLLLEEATNNGVFNMIENDWNNRSYMIVYNCTANICFVKHYEVYSLW